MTAWTRLISNDLAWLSHPSFKRAVEITTLAVVLCMAVATWLWVGIGRTGEQMVDPEIATLVLLGNLIPIVALMILIGRRIAVHRAVRNGVAGDGRLHARLVTMFSLLASVPIVLTVVAASVMFQSRNQYWVSSRAQEAFEKTLDLVRDAQGQIILRWSSEAEAMSADIARNLDVYPIGSNEGREYFESQTYLRNLREAVLFRYEKARGVEIYETSNPPTEAVFKGRIQPELLEFLAVKDKPAVNGTETAIWVVTPIPNLPNFYLYVATGANAAFLSRQKGAATNVIQDYVALQVRAKTLQLQFSGALFAVAILIIALTVWIALAVADRIVRPVNELVLAARDVEEGDLYTRVPEYAVKDEIGTLGAAFNSMASRLQQQTNDLVAANLQLESRRALIEAVMSGVSAGILSVDHHGRIQLINASAIGLLRTGEGAPVGHSLADIAPELAQLVGNDMREAIIQLAAAGEAKTLAVKITRDESGHVLTFDDITQQLLDQRRAAWSDVARRIAHEIKNPLTPIQLAAERLQRRYGKQIDPEDGVFARLTETIVRQVGDLRRMVDEFSSFARMPKPVFREESLVDLARQALFLHEVAQPDIDFRLDFDEQPSAFVCDRRQLGQALTNIVKNAVEAIEARTNTDRSRGMICMRLDERDAQTLALEIHDNGIGLPVERDRIVEPYMTTRARGTGLGLAIVKKIVEEHFGTIAFADRPGGGTIVTLTFDTVLLAELAEGGLEPVEAFDPPAPKLTRTGSLTA